MKKLFGLSAKIRFETMHFQYSLTFNFYCSDFTVTSIPLPRAEGKQPSAAHKFYLHTPLYFSNLSAFQIHHLCLLPNKLLQAFQFSLNPWKTSKSSVMSIRETTYRVKTQWKGEMQTRKSALEKNVYHASMHCSCLLRVTGRFQPFWHWKAWIPSFSSWVKKNWYPEFAISQSFIPQFYDSFCAILDSWGDLFNFLIP